MQKYGRQRKQKQTNKLGKTHRLKEGNRNKTGKKRAGNMGAKQKEGVIRGESEGKETHLQKKKDVFGKQQLQTRASDYAKRKQHSKIKEKTKHQLYLTGLPKIDVSLFHFLSPSGRRTTRNNNEQQRGLALSCMSL